jgi:hypothetical protein
MKREGAISKTTPHTSTGAKIVKVSLTVISTLQNTFLMQKLGLIRSCKTVEGKMITPCS